MAPPTLTQTVAAPSETNRRQPARKARTNAIKPANYYARPFAGRGAVLGGAEASSNNEKSPGFCPAITYFTDQITALPKEVTRHFTMLKEVEAKTFGPDEQQKQLCSMISALPLPPRKQTQPGDQIWGRFFIEHSAYASDNAIANVSASTSIIGHPSSTQKPGHEDTTGAMRIEPAEEQEDRRRQQLFFQLSMVTRQSLMALDEKIAVISTANDTLSKQLARLDSCWPYLQEEISEEARLGSTTHWAYRDRESKTSGNTVANERTRRDIAATNSLAAAAAAVHEKDIAATRSEARREAMLAKKSRNHNLDTDFDDKTHRKTQPSAKVRKANEAAPSDEGRMVGLGITNGATTTQANKRRKIEKGAATAATAPTMERFMSGGMKAMGRGGGNSREPVTNEGSKRKEKAASAVPATKKRNNPASAARQSASMASSPNQAAFAASKDFSPAPQRPYFARMRHNSTQSSLQGNSRSRPSPPGSNRPANGANASTADLNTVADLTGRNVPETKSSVKESYQNVNGGTVIEQEDVRGAIVVNNNSPQGDDESVKREDTDYPDAARPDAPAATTATSTRSGRATKPPAPLISTLPSEVPMYRSRSTRSNNHKGHLSDPPPSTSTNPAPVKRSHKKGQGLAAQAAAAAAASTTTTTTTNPTAISSAPSDVSSRRSSAAEPAPDLVPDHGSPENEALAATRVPSANEVIMTGVAETREEADDAEDEDANTEGEADGKNEPRYCYCDDVSYGEMVACDGEGCEREWFHLSCVGLRTAPRSNAKWYCDECKEKLKKPGRPGTAGRHV